MISKEVLVRAKFYQPGSKKYKFYAGNDGYLKYMKDRELNSPEGIPKSNYFSYMEGRPGSAGIWSNLKKIEPVPKKSLVWDVIVSFERKYAVENNLHVQEGTKRVIKANLDNFLVENGIDPDNVQVICSHHSNTDNPHVHMRINLRRPDVKNPDTGEMEFRRRGKFIARSLNNFKGNILE